MEGFERGTRCAWCSRVQDGDTWVEPGEAALLARLGVAPLWSDGICPSCYDGLVFPQADAGPPSEGIEG